jgi:hypothetical protein
MVCTGPEAETLSSQACRPHSPTSCAPRRPWPRRRSRRRAARRRRRCGAACAAWRPGSPRWPARSARSASRSTIEGATIITRAAHSEARIVGGAGYNSTALDNLGRGAELHLRLPAARQQRAEGAGRGAPKRGPAVLAARPRCLTRCGAPRCAPAGPEQRGGGGPAGLRRGGARRRGRARGGRGRGARRLFQRTCSRSCPMDRAAEPGGAVLQARAAAAAELAELRGALAAGDGLRR